MEFPVDDDACTEPVVEQQQREARERAAFTARELGEGCEVDVVLDADGAVQGRGKSRAEEAAVGAEVVSDASVRRDDAGDSDHRQVHGRFRRIHRASAAFHEPDDVGHAVIRFGEGPVFLRLHSAGRVDQHDVGGVMIDVHGRGETEPGVQGDASCSRTPRVTVDARGGDGTGILEHPQHLGHRRP